MRRRRLRRSLRGCGLLNTAELPRSPERHALRIDVADQWIDLCFDADLAQLADEVAGLWSHLAVSAHARDLRDATEATIVLDYTSAADPLRPHARVQRTTPTAAYGISGDVTRALIDRLRGARVLLHAGTVEHPLLGVIVMVGPSGAGKSSATTELGRSGGYLTDELTILDPVTHAITAYPKPVSRADPTLPGSGKCDVALPDLGLVPAPTATAPSLVLLLDRDTGLDGEQHPAALAPGAAGPGELSRGSVRRVPLAEALMRIIEQSSSLWTVPGGLASLAALITRAGGALSVRYREAADLESLLGSPPPPTAEEWEELPLRASGERPAAGQVALCDQAQAVGMETGIIVLVPGRSVLLDGLIMAVWEQVAHAGPTTPAHIEEHLIAELGPHPDSAALIGAALEELVACSLLTRG